MPLGVLYGWEIVGLVPNVIIFLFKNAHGILMVFSGQ